jgi:hypothetical protein
MSTILPLVVAGPIIRKFTWPKMGLIKESATAEVVAFTVDGALDVALFWAPTWGAVNKAPTVNTTTIFLMIVFFQNVG